LGGDNVPPVPIVPTPLYRTDIQLQCVKPAIASKFSQFRSVGNFLAVKLAILNFNIPMSFIIVRLDRLLRVLAIFFSISEPERSTTMLD